MSCLMDPFAIFMSFLFPYLHTLLLLSGCINAIVDSSSPFKKNYENLERKLYDLYNTDLIKPPRE